MIPDRADKPLGSSPLPREELRHWLGVAHRLPDVRTQKVMDARQAIRRHVYDDNDDIIDRTIEHLCRVIEAGPGEP